MYVFSMSDETEYAAFKLNLRLFIVFFFKFQNPSI